MVLFDDNRNGESKRRSRERLHVASVKSMKDFFELVVITFEKLSSESGGCCDKMIKVLRTLDSCKLSVEDVADSLDGLIVWTIRNKFLLNFAETPLCHGVAAVGIKVWSGSLESSDVIIIKMKKILTIIIEESEPLNLELVDLLVTSVRKENQIASPVCWELGDKVIKTCAAKLKPFLPDKVCDIGIALYDYCIKKCHFDVCQYLSNFMIIEGYPKIIVQRAIMTFVLQLAKEVYESLGALYDDGDGDLLDLRREHLELQREEIAPILESIFEKHGDIAAGCFFKTSSVRTSFLELICEVFKRIESSDVSTVISDMEDIQRQVSNAQAANINVSWLKTHLETIRKRNESMKTSTLLNTILVKRAAEIDLIESCRELMAPQERFVNAERCVKVLDIVERKLKESVKQPLIGN
ncbi:phospholipase-like protein [Tanacetum coccineum]